MKLVVIENGILQYDNIKDLYPGSKPTKTNFIDAEKRNLMGLLMMITQLQKKLN